MRALVLSHRIIVGGPYTVIDIALFEQHIEWQQVEMVPLLPRKPRNNNLSTYLLYYSYLLSNVIPLPPVDVTTGELSIVADNITPSEYLRITTCVV